jgi:putative restriction endonuclease
MSENVFLVPIEPENFDRTVRSPVDLTTYADRPDAIADAEEARLWAIGDDTGSGSTFEQMEPDDLLLFYDDGEYVGTGRVGQTFLDEDRWASSTLWTAFPATQVYTVASFTPITVSKRAVNRIFDYSPTYTPGLMRVADGRVTESLSTIETALDAYTKRQEA